MIYLCYPYPSTRLPDLPPGAMWIGAHGPQSVGGLDVETSGPALLACELARLITPDDVLVAVTEEAVLPVAGVARYLGATALSWDAALACTHRVRQRQALPQTLNPEWEEIGYNAVVKQATSCMGQGVLSLHRQDSVLGAWTTGPHSAVLERHVDGKQYEITVLVDGLGNLRFSEVLRQHWTHDNGAIAAYVNVSTVHQDVLRSVAHRVVRALGARWCALCIEARLSPAHGWKVIEVNARIGWDPNPARTGYDQLVFGGTPALQALVEHLTAQ